jgi:hypothetical protein
VDVTNSEELEYIVRVVSAIPDVLAVTRPGPTLAPKAETPPKRGRAPIRKRTPTKG